MSETYYKECWNARKLFKKADIVVLSVKGCQQLPKLLRYDGGRGVVVGFGRDTTSVRVALRGLKTVSTYHTMFWERLR